MNFKQLLIVALSFASCNRTYTPPEDRFERMERNAPISWFYQASVDGRTVVDDDCVFVGRVTADDRGGNFYRKIVVEDASRAVEINLGFWNTAALYPVGLEVAVAARGLSFALIDGVAQIGLRIDPWNTYRTEPFGHRAMADRYLFRNAPVEIVRPLVVVAAELTPELCGRLVRIDGALHTGDDATWGEDEFSSVAERIFSSGDVCFAVATSRYASFATRPVPHDTVSLTGILYRGARFSANAYTLKLRTENDIALD